MDYSKSEVDKKLLNEKIQKIVIVKQGSPSSFNGPIWRVVDIFLSIFVVSPLVICSWRGVWVLQDIHSQYFPVFPSFIAGITIHIIFAVCQGTLHKVIISTEKHWTLKLVAQFCRRFYTYLFLNITILHWRGTWALLDFYTNIQFNENNISQKEGCWRLLLVSATCLAVLVSIRGLRNATAPPFAICLDKGNYVFRFPTMFHRKSKDGIMLHILDCMFSVAVLGNLVILFWRGSWVVVDITLPSNFVYSSWASLILGVLLVGLVFRLQTCMKTLCSKYKGIPKVIIADSYILLSIIATILYWRGIWFLVHIYLFPNDVQLSGILSHVFSFMALVILGCSNSQLVRGVYKDGQDQNGGECVVFPCEYLRVILDQENLDKSRRNKEDAAGFCISSDTTGSI